MNSKWFFPFNIGIIVGLILGFTNGIQQIVNYNYFSHHLFNTITNTLASSINHYVPLAILSMCFIQLLFMAAKQTKGKVTTFNYSLIIALVAAFIAYKISVFKLLIGLINNALTPGVITAILSAAGWNMLGAIIILIIGIFYLRHLGRDKQKKESNKTVANFLLKLMAFINKKKLCYLLLAILAIINLTAGIYSFSAKRSVSNKPNVVLIIIDTIRSDRLGCYNPALKTTPNIDNLAKDGIRFNNAIAQAPYTAWSIGSFYTSRYPDVFYKEYLPTNYITVAEALKDNGYSTSAVISNSVLYAKYNFAKGYDYYDDRCAETEISSKKVTSIALKRLEKIKDKPFFLTVHYMDPHSSYNLHDEYNYYPDYKGKMSKNVQIPSFDMDPQNYNKTKDDLKYIKSLYDSEIRYTDYYIGKLIDGLKKQGVYKNSVIILVGDHGEEFQDHGNWFHMHTLYNEALSVPCIMRLPNCVNRGKTISGNFGLIDISPSILGYLDIDFSKYQFEGNAQDISDIEKCQNKYIYSAINFTEMMNRAGMNNQQFRSVQFGRYKYIEDIANQNNFSLYDHITDPTDQHGLKTENTISKHLKKVLHDHINSITNKPNNISQINNTQVSEQEKAILRSNGYLQ